MHVKHPTRISSGRNGVNKSHCGIIAAITLMMLMMFIIKKELNLTAGGTRGQEIMTYLDIQPSVVWPWTNPIEFSSIPICKQEVEFQLISELFPSPPESVTGDTVSL